jgi:hypothetical protein
MNPTFRKVALAAAALGLLLSLFLALRPGGDDESAATTPPATTTTGGTSANTTTVAPPATTAAKPPKARPSRTIRITVKGARPQGGILRTTVTKGDKVVLVVTSDVADEVHFHGYDLSTDVAPGAPARIAFKATVPGRFEVELEQRGVQLADIEVKP